MKPGTRVRLLETTAWPERRGLLATVLAPPADGTYPQPPKWEVLVAVDNDPLGCEWCVTGRKDVEVVA